MFKILRFHAWVPLLSQIKRVAKCSVENFWRKLNFIQKYNYILAKRYPSKKHTTSIVVIMPAETGRNGAPPLKSENPDKKTVFLPFRFRIGKRFKFKMIKRKVNKVPYVVFFVLVFSSSYIKISSSQLVLPQQPDPIQINNLRNISTTISSTTINSASSFGTNSRSLPESSSSNSNSGTREAPLNVDCGFDVEWSGVPIQVTQTRN